MIKFNKKIIQAPLAGYSCAPFRKIAWQWGQPDFCYTEMLSAKNIYLKVPIKNRYFFRDPVEGPLCVQLAGNEAEILAFAAEKIIEWGADLIDLNCGCPVPKIRKKKYGSKLLADSKHLYKLIRAIKTVVKIPVLIKIRVDGLSRDQFNCEVAKAIEDAEADAVTVHGRHWTEGYEIPVSYQDIAEIKQTISIPVIGNGDVSDTFSAKKMFLQTGCDALMIARASVGQPWIFEQIHQELQGRTFTKPTLVEIGDIFLFHIKELTMLEGESSSLLQARKLAKYYARGQVDNDFLSQVVTIGSYQELQEIVKRFFII